MFAHVAAHNLVVNNFALYLKIVRGLLMRFFFLCLLVVCRSSGGVLAQTPTSCITDQSCKENPDAECYVTGVDKQGSFVDRCDSPYCQRDSANCFQSTCHCESPPPPTQCTSALDCTRTLGQYCADTTADSKHHDRTLVALCTTDPFADPGPVTTVCDGPYVYCLVSENKKGQCTCSSVDMHTHNELGVTHAHSVSDNVHTHAPLKYASQDLSTTLSIAIAVPLGAACLAVQNGIWRKGS